MRRFAVCLAMMLLCCATALAETDGAERVPGGETRESMAQSGGNLHADIDALLHALQAAPNEQTAFLLEERLERTWLRSGGALTTLLMSRGLRALKAEQYDDAADCFTDAITLKPDFSTAFYHRGVARFHAGDVAGALADLRQAVTLEPHDFQAFRALADIAMSRGDWRSAYAAWQKLLAVDPQTAGGQARLRDLKKKVDGEDL